MLYRVRCSRKKIMCIDEFNFDFVDGNWNNFLEFEACYRNSWESCTSGIGNALTKFDVTHRENSNRRSCQSRNSI